MSKTFLEALTSVGKNLQSGINNLKETKAYVRPEEYGAVGDGITDDTSAILQAISTGKNVLLSGKSYALNTALYIRNSTNIMGEKGATLICNATHGVTVQPNNSSKIQFSMSSVTLKAELGVASLDPDYNTGSLIRIYNCDNVLIDDCYFYDTSGKQMLWFRDGTENGVVRHCIFYKNSPGLLGASVSFWPQTSGTTLKNMLIDDCDISHCAIDEVIDFMAGGDIENIKFSNCRMRNIAYTATKNQSFFISIYPTNYNGNAKNIQFNDCSIEVVSGGVINAPIYIRNGYTDEGEGDGIVTGVEFNRCSFLNNGENTLFSINDISTDKMLDVTINDCNIVCENALVLQFDGSNVKINQGNITAKLTACALANTDKGSLEVTGAYIKNLGTYVFKSMKSAGKLVAKKCTIDTDGDYIFLNVNENYSGAGTITELESYDCIVFMSKTNGYLFNVKIKSEIMAINNFVKSDNQLSLMAKLDSNTSLDTNLTAINNNFMCSYFYKPTWDGINVKTEVGNYSNGTSISYS